MDKERNINQLFWMMSILNLVIILYYCLLYVVTTYRLCDSFEAYAFLNSVRQMPQYPWKMPLLSISLYLGLCLLGGGKTIPKINSSPVRSIICITEIFLCIGIIASLNFYYSGVALLVLADLVHYIQKNRFRMFIFLVLGFIYAFCQFDIIAFSASRIPFSAYLGYYNQSAQRFFTVVETILVSANVFLFVFTMILLLTGERAENQRIRKLNEQLNDANTQLKLYAAEMEHMTEMRERNRLAREIHDTLGHTLTGIIAGADAALVLYDIAPEESHKRVQDIAQSARDGLTDVRRSIKALRPDALEQHSLEEALSELIDKFGNTTGVNIQYDQMAGKLELAHDEEDCLYRVIQESMTNSVRHGLAKNIGISVTRQEGVLTINICDDGVGAENAKEGFGLRHMRERLDMLGGTLAFGSREESNGFFVTVNMPIRKKVEP